MCLFSSWFLAPASNSSNPVIASSSLSPSLLLPASSFSWRFPRIFLSSLIKVYVRKISFLSVEDPIFLKSFSDSPPSLSLRLFWYCSSENSSKASIGLFGCLIVFFPCWNVTPIFSSGSWTSRLATLGVDSSWAVWFPRPCLVLSLASCARPFAFWSAESSFYGDSAFSGSKFSNCAASNFYFWISGSIGVACTLFPLLLFILDRCDSTPLILFFESDKSSFGETLISFSWTLSENLPLVLLFPLDWSYYSFLYCICLWDETLLTSGGFWSTPFS